MSRCIECDNKISPENGDLNVPKQYRWDYCKKCIDRDYTYSQLTVKEDVLILKEDKDEEPE